MKRQSQRKERGKKMEIYKKMTEEERMAIFKKAEQEKRDAYKTIIDSH